MGANSLDDNQYRNNLVVRCFHPRKARTDNPTIRTTLMSDKLFNIIIFGGLAVMLCAVYFFDPNTDSIFPPCPTNAITDLHCPGCGTLRALHALVHGNLKEAISQNVMAVIFLPILPIMAIFPKLFHFKFVPWAILIIFAIYTILRNLETFSFLAPH